MVTFGAVTDKNEIVTKFVEETNIRFKDANIVKNPFMGHIRTANVPEQSESPKVLHIVEINTIYFNFTVFGWLMLAALVFFIRHWHWSMILGIALGCLGIFWSRPFFTFMFKKGLRKAGYKGEIRIVGNEEVIHILGVVSYIMEA